MKQNETKIMPKLNEEYYCIHCNFSCSKKSNYKAHLLTAKHKKALNETNETRMNFDSNDLVCTSCLQSFSSRTTLWRHKKNAKKMPHCILTPLYPPSMTMNRLLLLIFLNKIVSSKILL